MKILSKRNKKALQSRNKLFIGYLPAGYPNLEEFKLIIKKCNIAGVDILEIGYPASSPFADGEVIQKANSLVDHESVKNISYWKQIRQTVQMPIWIMGYSTDLIDTGAYLDLAKAHVADAFVIPDIELKKAIEISDILAKYDIDLIPFVKNKEPNMEKIFQNFPMVYYQLVNGPTGSKSSASENLIEVIQKAKTIEGLYIFGGFGINNTTRAQQIAKAGFDGIIIGTEMLRKLNNSQNVLFTFCEQIKNAVTEIPA